MSRLRQSITITVERLPYTWPRCWDAALDRYTATIAGTVIGYLDVVAEGKARGYVGFVRIESRFRRLGLGLAARCTVPPTRVHTRIVNAGSLLARALPQITWLELGTTQALPKDMQLTIEALESLATEIETTEHATRDRLWRLIRAYTRILASRDPKRFPRMPLHHGDESGHFDSSFAPDQVYADRTGPRLLEIADHQTADIATSGGFYYSWRRVTEYGGLYVARDGSIWRADETGTGSVGRFAAFPGNCDVDCTIDWAPAAEVSTEELQEVEEALRILAFPLVAAKVVTAGS